MYAWVCENERMKIKEREIEILGGWVGERARE
jgi:hypothetical protein